MSDEILDAVHVQNSVVTQPSSSSDTFDQTIGSTTNAVSTNSPAVTTSTQSGNSSEQITSKNDRTTQGSQDRFIPIPDCPQDLETEQQKLGTDIPVVDVTVSIGNEAIEESLESRASSSLSEMFEGYQSFCRSFVESKYMLPIEFLLLMMPISACFMGARYMDQCPMSDATPTFLFMMGTTGSMVVLCRIFLIFYNFRRPAYIECKTLTMVINFGSIIVILLLATEMLSFLRSSPSFTPGDTNYCHKIFYIYTYWMNWGSLFAIAFLIILHVLSCRRET